MKKPTRLLLLALFATTPLQAIQAGSTNELQVIDDALEACIENDGSNLGMKTCTDEALKDADSLLNAVYQKFSSELSNDAEILIRLKTAQRAWIPFRDAQCQLAAAEMLGGTGESLIALGCHHKMTVDRIKQLEAQFEVVQ